MTNKQVAQAFAAGATSGRNANNSLYIVNDGIFSYGSHFQIASRKLADKTAVVTTRKYSPTTSRQTGLVHYELARAGYTISENEL